MKIKSKLAQRIIIAKAVWVVFWGFAFFMIPNILKNADLMLRFWVWLWYISIWVFIWLFWFVKSHPVLWFPMPYWFRWIVLGWWMNFVLCLFAYNNLIIMMQDTLLKWYSPFRIVVEWMVFWLVTDYLATSIAWEWKELYK